MTGIGYRALGNGILLNILLSWFLLINWLFPRKDWLDTFEICLILAMTLACYGIALVSKIWYKRNTAKPLGSADPESEESGNHLELDPKYKTRAGLLELSEMVRKLEWGDRDLDATIALAFGWVQKCDSSKYSVIAPHWYLNGRTIKEVVRNHYGFDLQDKAMLPCFTSSIDAAMSLIPKWLTPTIVGHERKVTLLNGIGFPVGGKDYETYAIDIATGISASAIKVLAHSLPETEDISDDNRIHP